MQLKHLKQFPHKSEVELSSRINKISYQYGNEFSSKNKIFAFVFRLQSTNQSVVAHNTGDLYNRRRTFKNIIQIAWKKGESYGARLTGPVVNREASYARHLHDEEEAFMMYEKSKNYLCRRK